ncbi:ceramidase domain-containing protein [Aquimarina sp. 2304DJ70-9]|uniref:ceramidase domain-containing protein n=1 Tax=Aquimarina penaris TaxID=3231044 RepID=UPI003462183E
MKKERTGISLLITVGILAIMAMFFLDPIVQDEQYHSFSDTRSVFSISNFWNVVSNLVFVVVGIRGLYISRNFSKPKTQYLMLFIGVSLIGLGSGYYHLFPSSQSLVWDRLPMTIVFMALFSIMISEFISEKLGRALLWPLILVGLGSIWYWVYGEMNDLRPYVLVQFYPMVAIPLILIFIKSSTPYGKVYWLLLIFYFFAKISEYYDEIIYDLLGVISGHSLKHIFAGLGLYILLKAYERRELVIK